MVASRAWARRNCPEVILGVYDRDEASAIDVTPAEQEKPSITNRRKIRLTVQMIVNRSMKLSALEGYAYYGRRGFAHKTAFKSRLERV